LMHNSRVKVLEPQWLIDEMKNILSETLKSYNS
jgi:predicted DNA-binding transcriptional regulator YafY